nr:probable WRKY transcription factor 70 [Ipomoea batatas]
MDVPENLLVRQRRAITVLVNGKATTVELQTLLQNPPPDGASSSLPAELVQQIVRSFNQAIFELTSGDAAAQICQIPSASACSAGLTFEDSGETTGKNKKKGRRGRYKKSKNSETWNKVSETQEDGGATLGAPTRGTKGAERQNKCKEPRRGCTRQHISATTPARIRRGFHAGNPPPIMSSPATTLQTTIKLC